MRRNYIEAINDEDLVIIELFSNLPANLIGRQISLFKNFTVDVDYIIAEGGFGVVYKCHSTNDWALKRCILNTKDKLKICVQEIQVMKSITNNHVLRLIDFVILKSGNEIYDILILTEYCDDNLSNVLKLKEENKAGFNEKEIYLILSHILEALNVLHNTAGSPIIHRDVKVENILIKRRTVYVLCDFGSVTRREIRPCDVSRDQLQEEINSLTTAAYRAPEMIDLYSNSGRTVIGRKVDIWALGIVLYNLCFMKLPFGEGCLGIVSAQFTLPDDYSRFYNENLMKLMCYCLTENPENRPNALILIDLTYSVLQFQKPMNSSFNKICLPPTDTEYRNQSIIKRNPKSKTNNTNKPLETSIAPRERRKPIQKSTEILPRSPSESNLQQNINLFADNFNSNTLITTSNINLNSNNFSNISNNNNNNNQYHFDPWSSASTSQLNQSQNHNVMLSNVMRPNLPHHNPPHSNHTFTKQPNLPNLLVNNSTNNMYHSQISFLPHSPNNLADLQHPANLGHRRMVSDGVMMHNYHQPICNVQPILQPKKLPIPKGTPKTAIEDFDPLKS